MSNIALTECHEETDALNTLEIESKAFKFLMVKKIHILLTYSFKAVFTFDFHWFSLNPLTIFPIAALC
ncbi:hypothetical protein SDC9_156897 [bioreactor metagenome]|uniref:Uncharacterized protein n=1 Tax=bioreactor metagenome TaxID=1076179 RepID=A0A645F7H9_9ZZZZ